MVEPSQFPVADEADQPGQAEEVIIPRRRLAELERVAILIIRRAAEVQSHVTQELGCQLEQLIVELDGDVSRHDALRRIWGATGRRPEPAKAAAGASEELTIVPRARG